MECCDSSSSLFGEIQNPPVPDLGDFASILKTAASSNGFFKHQQKDEPDLTYDEKLKIVEEVFNNRPSLFVERYGKYLSEKQLEYFEDLKSDDNYELNFFLQQARQSQCRFVKGNLIKNRRFAAMQKMLSENDDHFSENSMKARNPLLHEQLIGKFMTNEEKEEAVRPDMTDCSLSNIILEHMDLNAERDEKKRLEEEENEEEFDTEDEDESAEENEEEDLGRHEEGRDFLKKQFVKAAYQSFLDGNDVGVDYRRIDTDETLDDLDIEQREAEERYFDDSDIDE